MTMAEVNVALKDIGVSTRRAEIMETVPAGERRAVIDCIACTLFDGCGDDPRDLTPEGFLAWYVLSGDAEQDS